MVEIGGGHTVVKGENYSLVNLLGEGAHPGWGGGANLGGESFDLGNLPVANLGLKIVRCGKIDPAEPCWAGGDESFLPTGRAGIAGEAYRKTVEEFTWVKKDGGGGRR